MSEATPALAPRQPWPVRRRAAALLLLVYCHPALAAAQVPRRTPETVAAAAAAAQARASAPAAAEPREVQASVRRALDAIRQRQAIQDAARAAAAGQPSPVPDGLRPAQEPGGLAGLQVADGVTPDNLEGNPSWRGAALPTERTGEGGRVEVTVVQGGPSAFLTWLSFNVGRNTDLYFDQSAGGSGAGSWTVINRVDDPMARPSQILGSMHAEGQVYVLNPNGILFGAGSQVNVSTLVASGLGISADRFRSGEFLGLLAQGTPAFVWDGVSDGRVRVEEGARIEVAPYGQVLLVGARPAGGAAAEGTDAAVSNRGTIVAPDGQVLLAAGGSVSLQREGDSRSYSLAVDPRMADPARAGAGAVENQGIISTPRGNITLAGAEVRQDGLLTATTGAEAAGSIQLGLVDSEVRFGAGSATQILPDEGGPPVLGDGSTYRPSHVAVLGRTITFDDNAPGLESWIYAPSGQVDLGVGPPAGENEVRPFTERIYVGSGVRLDVSGLRDVDVAMAENSVRAELRANELRDNPVLRDSGLRGREVWFDARLGLPGQASTGLPGAADVTGYYDLRQRGVQQMMVAGGTLSLVANETLTRQGSTLDLSGGSLRFADGWVRSTLLIDPSGRTVRIEDALAGVPYAGLAGDARERHERWGISEVYASPLRRSVLRFESGYLQGASAGTLVLGDPNRSTASYNSPAPDPWATAAFRILDGEVVATTVSGPHQRELPTGSTDPTRAWRERPAGARLVIHRAGDLTIGGEEGPVLAGDFGSNSALDGAYEAHNQHQRLQGSWFDGHTFTRVELHAGYADDATNSTGQPPTTNHAPGGTLRVGAGTTVDLGDGGTFLFTGRRAEIDGTLRAAGGRVRLEALQLAAPGTPAGEASPRVRIGATGEIDVAGRVTNLRLGDGDPRALDGGEIALVSGHVQLEEGSLLDASGGARIDASGSRATGGRGGSILLDVTQRLAPSGAQQWNPGGVLDLQGTLRAYAPGTGGSLTIQTGGAVAIGELPGGTAGDHAQSGDLLLLAPEWFRRGGFASFSVSGAQGVTVEAGTALAPTVESLVLPADPSEVATGTRLSDPGVAVRQVVSLGQYRLPGQEGWSDLGRSMSLRLSSGPGVAPVTVEQGASIRTAPGSTVRLESLGTVRVDGTIEAPGGTIALSASEAARGDGGLVVGEPRVEVGDTARLRATGYEVARPSGVDTVRDVAAAGSISLSVTALATGARSGPRQAGDDVVVDAGAVLDASGATGIADLAVPAREEPGDLEPVLFPGTAGTISVSSVWGGLLAGELRLAPGGPSAQGGALSVTSRTPIRVVQGLSGGEAGTLTVIADRVNASGADDVSLRIPPTVSGGGSASTDDVSSAILFDGDVSLSSRRSLVLEAAQLGRSAGGPSTVSLRSSWVALVGGGKVTAPQPGAADLAGELLVEADLIDLQNTLWLGCNTAGCGAGGFGTATFRATGDIRLTDTNPSAPGKVTSGLFTTGEVVFDAAQLYVTSRSRSAAMVRTEADPGFLVWAGTGIAVRSSGAPAPVPLSFGERLTLRAPEILQGGVVRAPLGQIRLEGRDLAGAAAGSVTLLPGSITSVSLVGEGADGGLLVPYGEVLLGGDFGGYAAAGQAPEKAVTLDAPEVSVREGATLDVSGGGDLLGFRFQPGNQGSTDVLAGTGGRAAPALGGRREAPFAVVPSLGTQPAPLGGTSSLQDGRLQVGEVVYLQGVPGLPDGRYTLLPAHYALLPGGMLVQPLGGNYAAPPETVVRADGGYEVGGQRAVASTPIVDAGYGRYLVMPQAAFLRYGDQALSSFTDRAAGLALDAGVPVRTPLDAGGASLVATTLLELEGTGNFGAPPGGLLGNLDLAAPHLAVLGPGASAPDASYLVLDAGSLSAFGAGSVLVGGTRSRSADGTSTAVSAISGSVYVDTQGTAWTGPEILLAARQTAEAGSGTVTVAAGSEIRAEAAGSTASDRSGIALQGNGALLRLSGGERVAVARTGAAGAGGDLVVEDGVRLSAGSLTLEGSRSVVLAPGAVLAAGQVDLASVRVNVGDAPSGTAGVTLSQAQLAALAAGGDLLLRGHDSIHLYGDALAGPELDRLTLDTALFQGHLGGTTASLAARELAFRNSGAAATSAGEAGEGRLALEVGTLVLGPGAARLAGFGEVSGSAGAVEGRAAGSLELGGDLRLATGQVRLASGIAYALRAGGSLELTGSPAAEPAPWAALGGRLALEGASVLLDTTVTLAAGSLDATARSGDLRVGSGARLDLGGESRDFHGEVRHAPGGLVRLSAAGDLVLAEGSRIDVGAAHDAGGTPTGGDAGAIDLVAGGTATLAGELRGAAGPGGRGGSFGLDAGALDPGTPFSPLVGALGQGGFDASVRVELRGAGQDLRIGTGETLRAHEVVLRADGGSVEIDGAIDASGTAARAGGGHVALEGGQGVRVTGIVDASAFAGTSPEGAFAPGSGAISLASGGGTVEVGAGGRIDVSGGAQDGLAGGTVVVRAPRALLDGVSLQGDFRGARGLVLQGDAEYAAGSIDDALAAAMLAEAAAWQQGTATLAGLHPGWTLAPSLTVRSSGDLSVDAEVDLHGLAAPGQLTLVAAGSIDVRRSLSDGFASAARTAALGSGLSSGIELRAGGDVVLGAGALVRTGTGAISVEAGRDLRLAAAAGGQPAAALYTAGRAAAPEAGFEASDRLGELPVEGGDVALRAGRDIDAPLARQASSTWLYRYGDTAWNESLDSERTTVRSPVSWSVLPSAFDQGVAALGGGDVQVRAGRDVSELDVAIPTTGHLALAPGQPLTLGGAARRGALHVRGGGDLDLLAGGDVRGGLYLLGRGHAEVRAGGALLGSDELVQLRTSYRSPSLVLGAPRRLGLLVGLMDATARLTAGSSVLVEAAFDPAGQGQVAGNLVAGAGSSFLGYSARAALEATALGGPLVYDSNPWASVDPSLATAAPVRMAALTLDRSLTLTFGRAPPTLRLASLDGSLSLPNSFTDAGAELTLAPAAGGTLELLARRDVRIGVQIRMQDTGEEYLRGPLAPFASAGDALQTGVQASAAGSNEQRGFTLLHAPDGEPARVYSLEGSVCVLAGLTCSGAQAIDQGKRLRVVLPKPLAIRAGRDVVGGDWWPQNVGEADLTWIEAGRDLRDVILQLAGPGAGVLRAGRDILQEVARGTTSVTAETGGLVYADGDRSTRTGAEAREYNRALPHGRAADLYLLAGAAAGVDHDAFAAAYLDPENRQGVARTYLRPSAGSRAPSLEAWLQALDPQADALGDGELLARFAALPAVQRQLFLDQVLFAELQQTGVEYNDPASPRYRSFDRGFRAIALLFPGDHSALPPGGGGSVILAGKPLETRAEGDITVLAPYGSIRVGSDGVQNAGAAGGVVTRRGGDIRMMADGNIDLFTSRVFTLQGGDVTMWTSQGSITAGSGAKTSVFQAPLRYRMDDKGVVTIDAFGIATGAGIGVLDAMQGDEDRPRSRLDLIAPHGEVDAGDAGIRVVGDISIAAEVVVGIENIQASGAAAGVPRVEVPNLAVLTSSAQLAQAAAKEGVGPAPGQAMRDPMADLPSIITVEVVGYEVDEEEQRRRKARGDR